MGRVLQKLPEEKEMDSSTVSEKNVTFDFDTAQQSFTTFGNEETSDNLDWFGNETRKLHEKRVKREKRRKKKSLRTQILLQNAEEVGNAVAQTQDLDKENEQPKKKRKVAPPVAKKTRRVTEVKPFSFTLREERKKKEKENKMECSEDDDDDICFKMPMRPNGQATRKRQVASLSRLNELAKPKMKKTVSDSSLHLV